MGLDRYAPPVAQLRLFVGSLPPLLGLFVLGGWFAGIPDIVQLRPGWAPMQPNTALGMVGLGFLAWTRGTPARLAPAMGVGLLGVLAALEHTTGVVTGASTVILDPWAAARTVRPGLMSGATATAFILAGLSVWPKAGRVPATLVAVIGLASLADYVAGAILGGGASVTYLAAHTALGFVLWSVSEAFAWTPLRVGLGVAALSIAATLSVYERSGDASTTLAVALIAFLFSSALVGAILRLTKKRMAAEIVALTKA